MILTPEQAKEVRDILMVFANMTPTDYFSGGRNIEYWIYKAEQALQILSAGEEKPDGWQDISTAPKDGTPFLGYADWSADGFYDYHTVFWSNDFGWSKLGGDERNIPVWRPTHWQRLPDPPKPAEK